MAYIILVVVVLIAAFGWTQRNNFRDEDWLE